MAMDTDTGMEEKTMVRKRNSLILLASALLLAGCANSSLEITKNDIIEVARDDANATKKECSNVSIQAEKGAYAVSFDTDNGSYEYKIGKNGIIQDRHYTRKENNNTEKTEEKVVTSPKKEEETKTKEKNTTKQESFDDNQQQAINSSLANAGLEQDDVQDLTCTLDAENQQYTVTFTVNGIHNTVVVSATDFTVLSSIQA